MNATKAIRRERFRAPPPAVADLLRSLATYQPVSGWPRDCRRLADILADAEPFTLILFAEPLAPEHWRRRSHTVMRRVELVSELDETVFRHFDRELNDRMADWLREHPDPENVHLRALVREYYPRAKAILRAEYQDRYPRAWKRRWTEGKYQRPRIKVECRRRYDLPEPLGLANTSVPQQFYFLRQTATYGRGCGSGSSTREAHSYFGLAFLELTRRGLRVPCHILVYDRHNRLLLADALPDFAVYPGSIGSNCAEPHKTVRELMRTAQTVSAVKEADWTGIREIRISRSVDEDTGILSKAKMHNRLRNVTKYVTL
jgi:hypothetical protein